MFSVSVLVAVKSIFMKRILIFKDYYLGLILSDINQVISKAGSCDNFGLGKTWS